MSVNILLVDDHTIVTDGLKAMLAGESDYVIKGEAANGQEALEMLRILKVDVILMDIDMPVMNGIDASRVIKKEMPEKKIIILTMHDEKAMIRMLLDIGVDGYLLKNSPKKELLTAIDNVISGSVFLSEEANGLMLSAESPQTKNENLSALTDREIEIITCIAEGLSNKEIGDKLFISHRTVDTHRTNLMSKLNLHNVAGIVKFAIVNGLTI